jgi:dienelactone hydrolase
MQISRRWWVVVLLWCTGLSVVVFSTWTAPEVEAQEHVPEVTRGDLTTVYSQETAASRDLTYKDSRLLTMTDTDTRFTLNGFENRQAWERRAAHLRDHVQIAAGLWPMHEKNPLNARVFDSVEGDGYTVEKVYFETYPEFFLAGNLYRPTDAEGPHPAILSPHGHWTRGRLNDTDRGSIPARAINFARQGYVVFAYDMIGYGDTRQVNHSFAADSLSDLWSINLLGLQLRNGVRALDFMRSLDDVDDDRIGITGASGGATQTMMLTALDEEELKVTAPVNMISTIMQGGSLCENAPGLRLDAFNIHIGALAAPRPQLMVSNTQDWTVNTPTREYPMMRSFYQLYGKEDRVRNAHFDFQHNYNEASRNAVYPWFARWLKGVEDHESYREEPYQTPADEDLLVFLNEAITDRSLTYQDLSSERYRSLPEGFAAMDEPALIAYLQEEAREQISEHWPASLDELGRFEAIYGTGYRHVMAAEWPEQVRVEDRGLARGSDFTVHKHLIAREGTHDWIPAVRYQPEESTGTATVVIHPEGKAGLVAASGHEPGAAVEQLLEAGHQVLAIDPFKVGEHTLYEGTVTQRDESINHFLTFNRSDVQEQVQDILTAVAALQERSDVDRVNLVGVGEAAVWVVLAGGIPGSSIDHTVALELPELAGAEEGAREWFVPGLLRMGGLETAAALGAPIRLTLHGAGRAFDIDRVKNVYRLHGAEAALQTRVENPVVAGGLGKLLSP